LQKHKSASIYQIPAEPIKAGGETPVRSDVHKIFISVCNKEEVPDQWKESIIVPIYKDDDKTDCGNYRGI
jgi:hypothetical protein